ncbi:LytR/AlgR family response regulator transcription factor [Sphingobacterium paludis]|uniref:LytTR family two component transcriptional regulator n=1 Tax=Sphingobacterium paludis TaxID=1476465 RepID=A0A4R7D8S7_9SPHI|nr:response regulator [Sphingobacterium paludis]TDS17420.1 LytTR family two component transcriptional regulator [Sphingobacterium paludis]
MNTKLKCLLLDDELPSLSYLKLLCEQIPDIEVVKAFNDPRDFLQECQHIDFDVLITDIEMPHIKGLDLVQHLPQKAVIFTTAYDEYAADAFDLQVIDYVRKPLQLNRLKQALEKVSLWQTKTLETQKSFIQVNSDKGKYLLYFNQIAYITTSALDSRDKVVHLLSGNEVTLKNISFHTLQGALPATAFCQVNKKEIIALSIVTSFSHEEISSSLLAENGQLRSFSLRDKYKTEFLQKVSI